MRTGHQTPLHSKIICFVVAILVYIRSEDPFAHKPRIIANVSFSQKETMLTEGRIQIVPDIIPDVFMLLTL